MRLFAAQSDWSLAGVHRLDNAHAHARRQLAPGRWSVYQARHVFIGPTAMRSVRTLRTDSRDRMAAWLAASGSAETGEHGMHQSWLRRSPAGLLPRAGVRVFYLGTHRLGWLTDSDVPLFVSDTRLRSYRRLPRSSCRWALDSGGYSQLLRTGGWADGPTPHQYAARVRRYAAEVGRLDWAATQDWLTDPVLLARTGLPVRRHIELTVASYLELASIDETLPFIPILQGWLPGDYEACAALYERHGVNLQQAPMVGVGSVAHRQGTVDAANIIAAVRQVGISRIHTFGVDAGPAPIRRRHLLQ